MKSVNLGSERTWPVILKLALPAMAAQIVNVLYSIVDKIYVGQLGNDPLAGIGVCAPIGTTLTAFAFWVSLGGGPLFSMSLGEKREDNARKILANSFLLLILFAVVLDILTYALMSPMLYAFGASTFSFPYAKEYLEIYLIGLVFSILSLGLNEFLTAQGMSLAAMLSTLVACLLNIGLDPLFMFACHLGIRGAALATILCQFVSFLVSLFLLLRKKTEIRLTFGSYDIKLMGKILKLGFSPFIILATDSILLIVYNKAFQHYGSLVPSSSVDALYAEGKENTDYGDFLIEVNTIVSSFESLVTGPLLGISTGTQPILAYNYGAKREDLIKKSEKQIFTFAIVFTAVCFGLSYLLERPFAELFIRFQSSGGNGAAYQEALVEKSVRYIQVYMFAIVPLSLQYVTVDGLTGMGQANTSIWLSINRKFFVMLPAILLFPLIFQAMGKSPVEVAESSFYAEFVADIASAITSTTVYFIVLPKILKKRMETKKTSLV